MLLGGQEEEVYPLTGQVRVMVIRGVSVDQTVGFRILEVVALDGTVGFRIFQDRCACQWTGQLGSGIFYRCVHIHQSHETVPSRSL